MNKKGNGKLCFCGRYKNILSRMHKMNVKGDIKTIMVVMHINSSEQRIGAYHVIWLPCCVSCECCHNICFKKNF